MPRTQVRAAAAREQQGEATRGRLVEVAVAALERGGEQAIKVREIANAILVNRVEQLIASYGHARFTTDASKYRPTAAA